MSGGLHPHATPEEMRETIAQIELMLGALEESLARIPLAGDLNAEQNTRVLVALTTVGGLRRLFADERNRLDAK